MRPVVVRARGWARGLLVLGAGIAVGLTGVPPAVAAAAALPDRYWALDSSRDLPITSYDVGGVEPGERPAKTSFALQNNSDSEASVNIDLNGSSAFAMEGPETLTCRADGRGGRSLGRTLSPHASCRVDLFYFSVPGFQTDTATLTASGLQGDAVTLAVTAHPRPVDASFTSAGCSVWTVPPLDSRLPRVAISAVGSSGGSAASVGGLGGAGDGVSATLSVAPGEKLNVCVNVGGVASLQGYVQPSGGASGVSMGSTFARPVLVAGGGGSGAWAGRGLGIGGNAGLPAGATGQSEPSAMGGGGGDNTTRTGGAGGGGGSGDPGNQGASGSGFTAAGPGAGGIGSGGTGVVVAGGNGGAGYYGGGGGGMDDDGDYAGGGGGGSDFCTNTAVVSDCSITPGLGTSGAAGSGPGDAQVTISYFPPTAGGADRPRCADHEATVPAAAHRDRIAGTRERDVIAAGSGNDRISAGEGNDLVCAGAGNDIVLGGPGDDRITAGPGRDRVSANAGDDRIFARDGQRDAIDCGPGDDVAIVDRGDVTRGCDAVIRPRRHLRQRP